MLNLDGREAVKKAFCAEISQHIMMLDVIRTNQDWNERLVFQIILNLSSINSVTIFEDFYSCSMHKLIPLFFTTLLDDTLFVVRRP